MERAGLARDPTEGIGKVGECTAHIAGIEQNVAMQAWEAGTHYDTGMQRGRKAGKKGKKRRQPRPAAEARQQNQRKQQPELLQRTERTDRRSADNTK